MGYRTGRRYYFKPPSRESQGGMLFWAEKGVIIILDERFPEDDPRHLMVLSRRHWLHNISAINRSINHERLADEREALHRLVENACTCAKEAGRQGDPMDPEYARDMLLRRRRSMLLAGTGDAFKPGVLSGSVAPESLYIPPLFSKPEE